MRKKSDYMCFSPGWPEFNTEYNLTHGASVTMVSIQPSRWVIQVKDRYGDEIKYPRNAPPLFLRLNRDIFPTQMGSELITTANYMLRRRELHQETD